MTIAISDDKIATAIAKLHSDGAISEANLVETVIDFLRTPEIHDAQITNFRIALIAVVNDFNEYHRKQVALDE